MSLVTSKLESNGNMTEFASDPNLPRDIPSVLAGLANVHAQFNQYLTSSLHLNMEPENDEVRFDQSESEESESDAPVLEAKGNASRKKAKK